MQWFKTSLVGAAVAFNIATCLDTALCTYGEMHDHDGTVKYRQASINQRAAGVIERNFGGNFVGDLAAGATDAGGFIVGIGGKFIGTGIGALARLDNPLYAETPAAPDAMRP